MKARGRMDRGVLRKDGGKKHMNQKKNVPLAMYEARGRSIVVERRANEGRCRLLLNGKGGHRALWLFDVSGLDDDSGRRFCRWQVFTMPSAMRVMKLRGSKAVARGLTLCHGRGNAPWCAG